MMVIILLFCLCIVCVEWEGENLCWFIIVLICLWVCWFMLFLLFSIWEIVDFFMLFKCVMFLMVSWFCILLFCNVLFNYLSLILFVYLVMGKVWFIVGLVVSRYYIVIDVMNIIGFFLLFVVFYLLIGGYMEFDFMFFFWWRLKLFW